MYKAKVNFYNQSKEEKEEWHMISVAASPMDLRVELF